MQTITRAGSVVIGLAILAGGSAFAQDNRLGPTKERLKTNYVASCIPSARTSTKGNVSEEAIAAYCNCSAAFIDELPDDLVVDLVNTEIKKENPSKEVMIRLLAKAQTCRPKSN